MKKFTWKDIMESGDYILTHSEYASWPCYCDTAYWEEGKDMNEFIHWGTCQVQTSYQVDDQESYTKEEYEENKKWLLDKFYEDLSKWEHRIRVEIVNVDNLGYYMYMVDFRAHEQRKDGYEIGFGYVHKDDLEIYLARRDNW